MNDQELIDVFRSALSPSQRHEFDAFADDPDSREELLACLREVFRAGYDHGRGS